MKRLILLAVLGFALIGCSVCTPGDVRTNSGKLEVCNDNGKWVSVLGGIGKEAPAAESVLEEK